MGYKLSLSPSLPTLCRCWAIQHYGLVWWEKAVFTDTSESFPIKSKQSVSEGVKNTSRPEGQSAAAVIASAPPVLKCQCHSQGRQHSHPFPLSLLLITTPLPGLSSSSDQPNSSTAGLSHQLYGVSWCQLKELIRGVVCSCVQSQSGSEVSVSKRECACAFTQIHIYL